MTGPNEPTEVDELEVEMCLELARQWDQEDMTHPPYRPQPREEEEDGAEAED